MRWLIAVLLVIGCGGNDSKTGGADAATGIDASTIDASTTPGIDGAVTPPVDAAPVHPDAGSSLGRLCATEAPDGGIGSCPGAVCCNTGGSTICTLPDDCITGPNYVSCTHTSDCQGRICCLLASMEFCTKAEACDAYGGRQVP